MIFLVLLSVYAIDLIDQFKIQLKLKWCPVCLQVSASYEKKL